jgi:hypothetical protein
MDMAAPMMTDQATMHRESQQCTQAVGISRGRPLEGAVTATDRTPSLSRGYAMNNSHLIGLILTCLAACADAGPPALPSGDSEDFELYVLAGQSNMEGYGHNTELPAALQADMDAVFIFHGTPAPDQQAGGGLGVWAPLGPGHGVGFSSDGVRNASSTRFGPELTFAQRLHELRPGVRIAIVKYARGGTSIDTLAAGQAGSWDPAFRDGQGINQFDHFLATLQNALANTDVDGDGSADDLLPSGILWMQGESDANHEIAAQRYEQSLNALVREMRSAIGVSEVPVVIGRISDSGRDDDGRVWDYGPAVREAQAAFVASDVNAALVTSTDNYSYSDPWHYDSAGYLDLGRRFAEAIHGLIQR